MKNILFACLLVMVVLTGCKKPEESKSNVPFAGGGTMMPSQDETRRLEQIAKQAPKNTEAWIALGNNLMDASRFGEAVDAYQKALALDSKNVDVRVDMGTCYRGMGKPEKAMEEYKKAIKINPNHVNAHRNMGVVLAFDLRRNKDAIKEFEKYLELAPNAPDAPQIRQTVGELKTMK